MVCLLAHCSKLELIPQLDFILVLTYGLDLKIKSQSSDFDDNTGLIAITWQLCKSSKNMRRSKSVSRLFPAYSLDPLSSLLGLSLLKRATGQKNASHRHMMDDLSK